MQASLTRRLRSRFQQSSRSSLPRTAALGLTLLLTGFAQSAEAQRICLTAELTGAQEVPANGSPGKGTACVIVDTAANTLTFQITVAGLVAPETGAHIHGYVPTGVNGPVLFALPPGATKTGIWFYPPADEANILAGLSYVNIHSAAFPGGELRGQLKRDISNATLMGRLSGAQEVPPTPSAASGTACFSVDTTAKTVTYNITYAGLMAPETGAHIHGPAPAGVNAGVKTPLPLGFHKTGVWNYAAADEADILGGLTYVNIHSTGFPGGEIRGQMDVICKCNPMLSTYCTAGTSASGCMAMISATGFPSATLTSGFTLSAATVEGNKTGIFFYGTNGQQANPWGNGTSFQCVIPPVKRGGILAGTGTTGNCDGTFTQDLNARWCPTCPKPSHNPGAGAVMQAQLWYRDPMNTSNQTTSLSNAVEFTFCP